jgi:hypothetical protein
MPTVGDDDKATILMPTVGDPAYNKSEFWYLKKTLHGLRRNWPKSISPHDSCLFS